MAPNLELERKRHRLIIIKNVSLDMYNITSLSMKSYLCSYTYIEYSSPYWKNNLNLYWLPQRGMCQLGLLGDDVNHYTRPLLNS